jgi:hypothetical protein
MRGLRPPLYNNWGINIKCHYNKLNDDLLKLLTTLYITPQTPKKGGGKGEP